MATPKAQQPKKEPLVVVNENIGRESGLNSDDDFDAVRIL